MSLGLDRGTVLLTEYNHIWKQEFEEEAGRLKEALGELLLEIHHIGSTAIPGCTAKPILDLAVVLPSFESAGKAIAILRNQSYGREWIHILPDRVAMTKGQPVTHHLYLTLKNSVSLSNWLCFRDKLRQSTGLRYDYTLFKAKLANLYPNCRVAYTNAKADFIKQVIYDQKGESSNGE